jgi:hypothetical protein
MKPVKCRYKLCHADMSGYIYEYDVYQGKMYHEASKNHSGLCQKVMKKLTSSLHHSYCIVIMDKYFISFELFYALSHGICACWTVHPNYIGLPELPNHKDLKRGEFVFRISSQRTGYFKWKKSYNAFAI